MPTPKSTKTPAAKQSLAGKVVRPGMLERPVAITRRKKLSDTQRTALIVSVVWLVIGATVLAFLLNSQAQYNRGVFDGMTKTKAILQSK